MRRALKPVGRISAIIYSTAENNKLFSIPDSIIRCRANLPPLLPGEAGPFSLGSPGVLEKALRASGFHGEERLLVQARVKLRSTAECVRFEKESFGTLHQMRAGLAEPGREAAWAEIECELKAFEDPSGLAGPCEPSLPSEPGKASPPAGLFRME